MLDLVYGSCWSSKKLGPFWTYLCNLYNLFPNIYVHIIKYLCAYFSEFLIYVWWMCGTSSITTIGPCTTIEASPLMAA